MVNKKSLPKNNNKGRNTKNDKSPTDTNIRRTGTTVSTNQNASNETSKQILLNCRNTQNQNMVSPLKLIKQTMDSFDKTLKNQIK